MNGWAFDSEELLDRYRGQIKAYFKPVNKIHDDVDQVMKLRTRQFICIGCHIRKGDYHNFIHGKFF